jgi:hypothetical protein
VKWAARVALSVLGVAALGGCGSSGNSGGAPAASADVLVTLDGKRHTCLVALKGEPQGSAVACAQIAPFIRDELRVPAGARYGTHTVGDIDAATLAQVEADLKGAGYRPVGDH